MKDEMQLKIRQLIAIIIVATWPLLIGSIIFIAVHFIIKFW